MVVRAEKDLKDEGTTLRYRRFILLSVRWTPWQLKTGGCQVLNLGQI